MKKSKYVISYLYGIFYNRKIVVIISIMEETKLFSSVIKNYKIKEKQIWQYK